MHPFILLGNALSITLWKLRCHFFSTYYVCKYLKQSRCVRFSFSIDYGAEKMFLLVGHLHYYFLKLLLFPNLSLGKTVSGPSHPKERLGAGRHSFRVCRNGLMSSHDIPPAQRECKSQPEILIQVTQNRMQHKNIILWVLWFFFSFELKWMPFYLILHSFST